MTSHYDFFATAPKYTEGLLLEEITRLGVDNARETVGGVNFSGSLKLGYQVCLWSRIANRLLLRLRKTKITNIDDLYEAVYQINWLDHFDVHHSFLIDFTSNSSLVTHSQYGAQKCKDAIVDQFRHQCGSRPDVSKQNPSIRINVHVKNQTVNISIDLSGHSLHQRGYRKHNVEAPLKENLAAAMLIRSGWTKQDITPPLVDPMCGSGTLLIEAALIASNTAPGLIRTDFGFDHWKDHDESLWLETREQASTQKISLNNLGQSFMGFDIDQNAVEAARKNAEHAGMTSLIVFEQQAITELINDNYGDKGYLITNPPYGERLSENEKLLPLYETLGNKLKTYFKGWNASIITSDSSLAKAMRLQAKRKNKLYNGKLLCTIYHFDINEQDKSRVDFQKNKEEFTPDSNLENRLAKNIMRLKKWATKQSVTCYRIYDADLPEYNFALDYYKSDNDYYVFQEYAAPASISIDKVKRRSRIAQYTVTHALKIQEAQLFYKQRKKQQGSDQYVKLDDSKHRHVVQEGSCSFYVNFEDYLDTGLFLDHRMTRQLIHKEAQGKTFLNLFCYTGTASVHAALGGAKSTTSVDLSSTYLSWCKDNFELNDIPLNKHKFIKADCMKWLKSETAKFDLIFVDPPTFSNSKSMDDILDIQRDYIELLENCAKILTENGKIIFSTNFRKFRFDEKQLPKLKIHNLTLETIPEDFTRNKKIHQCWQITKL